MENLHEAIRTSNFRYLTEDAIQTPLSFIENFCYFETEVETFRKDILFFLHAATTRKSDFNGKFYVNSEDYAYNCRQLISVIEVLWVLYHQPIPQLRIPDTHPLYQKSSWATDRIDIEKRINSGAAHFRKLENREINDIGFFLEEFFLYRNLNEWREILDDLLTYAYTNESIFDGTELLYESVAIYEYLEKAVEAIFLIADLNFKYNKSTDDIQTKGVQETNLNPTAQINGITLPNPIQEVPSLDDDTFTNNLIQYLEKFWSHLEESNGNHSYGPVMFTETLEKELLSYFESFHPKFLSRNFRRIYMGYLEHLFANGTPWYYHELRAFTAHMDTFFELLELADQETAHWPQEDRIGWDEN